MRFGLDIHEKKFKNKSNVITDQTYSVCRKIAAQLNCITHRDIQEIELEVYRRISA